MVIREIIYGSQDYQKTLDLRNQVMRKPLGLDIFQEDFSHEKQALILGVFAKEELLAVGVMGKVQDNWSVVEYLCVDNTLQSHGVGKLLLAKLEEISQSQKQNGIWLEARVSAQGFYEKLGYQTTGEKYFLPHAPVEHIKMVKYFC